MVGGKEVGVCEGGLVVVVASGVVVDVFGDTGVAVGSGVLIVAVAVVEDSSFFGGLVGDVLIPEKELERLEEGVGAISGVVEKVVLNGDPSVSMRSIFW